MCVDNPNHPRCKSHNLRDCMTSSVGDISHWEFFTKLFTLIDYSLEIKTFGLGSRIGDIFSKICSVAHMYAAVMEVPDFNSLT